MQKMRMRVLTASPSQLLYLAFSWNLLLAEKNQNRTIRLTHQCCHVTARINREEMKPQKDMRSRSARSERLVCNMQKHEQKHSNYTSTAKYYSWYYTTESGSLTSHVMCPSTRYILHKWSILLPFSFKWVELARLPICFTILCTSQLNCQLPVAAKTFSL